MTSLKDGKYAVTAHELEGATMLLMVEIAEGKIAKVKPERDYKSALEEAVFPKGPRRSWPSRAWKLMPSLVQLFQLMA